MSKILVCALTAALLMLTVVDATSAAESAVGDEGITALHGCRLHTEDKARLACYDHAVDHYFSFDFHGNGRENTPIFESQEGFQLEFHSASVIFVVYVFNADSGELVNTYSSGPGEGKIRMHEGGRFYIEVKATDSWKIRVRPLATADESNRSNTKEDAKAE
ncbi:hypothetical protein [Denitrificimonas caeni]|uniref:hypothetical protein n=1 Tax=Denitrificimonas caeni TaxID=521720 RepID=UPI00196586EA|nr:hypothetical protein [Denitrificimonas caeni]